MIFIMEINVSSVINKSFSFIDYSSKLKKKKKFIRCQRGLTKFLTVEISFVGQSLQGVVGGLGTIN
jgi:hypothetical protein